MKKKIISLLLVIFILSNMSFVVGAQEKGKYLRQAEQLKTLGVFQGTENGFELEREPSRLEGIVMLVRLLGKEKEALTLSKEACFFTDVPNWAKGYVNYAYKYNLTKGIGGTLFGSNNKMNAKSYLTFMLRALGYDDTKGDFLYKNAIDDGILKGLLSIEDALELTNEIFLRDHIAMVSMKTLYTKYKNQSNTLLQKLVAEGSISKEQALLVDHNKVLTAVEIGKLSDAVVYIEVTGYDGTLWSGSGFYVSQDGNLITNYHVVEGAKKIEITENNGTKYTGTIKIIGYSKEKDIAVLDIDKTVGLFLEIGDSSKVLLGEDIYTIGSPLSLQNTLSSGIVSAIRNDYIQISAPISQGSSGGALLNNKGKVIGITSAGYLEGENLGFAIPINQYKALSKNLNLDLASFYTSIVHNVKPTGVSFISLSNGNIGVYWDKINNADYYSVYLSLSVNGPYLEMMVNGLNEWDWNNEYCMYLFDLIEESTYYVKVTATIDGVESAPSDVKYFETGTQLSLEEYGFYLEDTYSELNLNGYQVNFDEVQVFNDDEEELIVVCLYIRSDSVVDFINMIEYSKDDLEMELALIASETADYYGVDVTLSAIFTGPFNSYPTALEENALYSNTITYEEAIGKWWVFYPFVNIELDREANEFTPWWAF